MGVVFVLVMFGYAIALLIFARIWSRLPEHSIQAAAACQLKITIVIPVRNEASNILKLLNCIQKQKYPGEYFEVIIVDDQSTDNTYHLVNEFQKNSPIQLRLLKANPSKGSPKKQAIEMAVEASNGEVILTTDGDCQMGPDWLMIISQAFLSKDCKMVMAPVAYQLNSLNDRLQWVEFSALQGLSAVLLHLGIPAMGNGANLAYRKIAFNAVQGFDGNKEIASGDDEFLVRKIANKYGADAITYLKSPQAIVKTKPAQGWSKIKHQKVRWASKWKRQSGWQAWLLPLFVFLINLTPLIGFFAYAKSLFDLKFLLAGWALKGLADIWFSYTIGKFLQQSHRLVDLILAEIIYPVYVLFFGIASIFGKYTWKGRRYNE